MVTHCMETMRISGWKWLCSLHTDITLHMLLEGMDGLLDKKWWLNTCHLVADFPSCHWDAGHEGDKDKNILPLQQLQEEHLHGQGCYCKSQSEVGILTKGVQTYTCSLQSSVSYPAKEYTSSSLLLCLSLTFLFKILWQPCMFFHLIIVTLLITWAHLAVSVIWSIIISNSCSSLHVLSFYVAGALFLKLCTFSCIKLLMLC